MYISTKGKWYLTANVASSHTLYWGTAKGSSAWVYNDQCAHYYDTLEQAEEVANQLDSEVSFEIVLNRAVRDLGPFDYDRQSAYALVKGAP